MTSTNPQANEPGKCPVCNGPLEDRGCKRLCVKCRYVESCEDNFVPQHRREPYKPQRPSYPPSTCTHGVHGICNDSAPPDIGRDWKIKKARTTEINAQAIDCPETMKRVDQALNDKLPPDFPIRMKDFYDDQA